MGQSVTQSVCLSLHLSPSLSISIFPERRCSHLNFCIVLLFPFQRTCIRLTPKTAAATTTTTTTTSNNNKKIKQHSFNCVPVAWKPPGDGQRTAATHIPSISDRVGIDCAANSFCRDFIIDCPSEENKRKMKIKKMKKKKTKQNQQKKTLSKQRRPRANQPTWALPVAETDREKERKQEKQTGRPTEREREKIKRRKNNQRKQRGRTRGDARPKTTKRNETKQQKRGFQIEKLDLNELENQQRPVE